MFDLTANQPPGPVIRVIGVGTAGGKTLQHMQKQGVRGVGYLYADCDEQALDAQSFARVVHLGKELPISKGLGESPGGSVSRQAVFDCREQVERELAGADLIFLTVGLGGGTGTGAAPVISQIARELGVLTIAVVTRPFEFEGRQRNAVARNGLEELAQIADTSIALPNDRVLATLDSRVSLTDAYAAIDSIVSIAVRSISDLLTGYGILSINAADIRSVTAGMGLAALGFGRASGEGRGPKALQSAIDCPLLGGSSLHRARGILLSVAAGEDLMVCELKDIIDRAEDLLLLSNMVIGRVTDPEMGAEVRVTIIATGLDGETA